MVVTAAGKGVRLDSDLPKQYVPLLGVPMLTRTLVALDACDQVDALVVVVDPGQQEYCLTEIVPDEVTKVIAVVEGGEERALSVRNGLQALRKAGDWDLVGVHDGARPLVTCADVERVVDTLVDEPLVEGAVLAVRSTDTIKVVDAEGRISDTPSRDGLWRAQTPQVFRWKSLMSAYDQPEEVLLSATDDSALVEMRGGEVRVVEGSPENLKITDRSDFRCAEMILAERGR